VAGRTSRSLYACIIGALMVIALRSGRVNRSASRKFLMMLNR
jgi:hypothetical protein